MVVNVPVSSFLHASAAKADDMMFLLEAGLPAWMFSSGRGIPLMKQVNRRARAIAIAQTETATRITFISFMIAAFATVAWLVLPSFG